MKFVILKKQLDLINEEIENSLSTSDSTILKTNLESKPDLIPIYQEIERKLKDKFTQDHFDKEKKYSGGLKDVSSTLDPDAVSSFKDMLKKYGKKGKVKISTSSLRNYQQQKNTFLKYAIQNGRTINGGLRQAALPGFSQHHTGKALDISNSHLVSDDMLSSFDFERPYSKDTGFRMAEPWHIFYNGSFFKSFF